MKVLLGFLAICLVAAILLLLILGFWFCAPPPKPVQSNTATANKPANTDDVLLDQRRKAIADYEGKSDKTGLKVKLSGAAEDVLEISSPVLSLSEIHEPMRKGFPNLKQIGFTKVVITDKRNEKLEVDLASIIAAPALTPIPKNSELMKNNRKLVAGLQNEKLKEKGLKIGTKGDNYEIITCDSDLPNSEALEILKKTFEEFKKAGFDKIILTGKNNEVQEVDLTALK